MSTPETQPTTPPPLKQSPHSNLQPLDRQNHRLLRLNKYIHDNYTPAEGMNALFLNAVEFIDASREYPIVFVRSGEGGEGEAVKDVAPMAVLGLKRGENLFLGAGGTWSADYVPASLRAYPFALVRSDENNYLVCFDRDWSGFSEQEGQALFDEKGEPTDFLKGVQGFLETLEGELQRTQQFGRRLLELGLLQSMRFDATLEGGANLVVDGFLAVDEKKFAELPAATLGELQASGMLGLIFAHLFSMGNMRRLVERRVKLNLPA